jgi:hypothetical protein
MTRCSRFSRPCSDCADPSVQKIDDQTSEFTQNFYFSTEGTGRDPETDAKAAKEF